MCGILGIIGRGRQNAGARLFQGLQRLEYRGYDSAGIAIHTGGAFERRRAPGKLSNLEAMLKDDPLQGHAGIAHTRWATHGVPNEVNAHPHIVNTVALVHNGIIENHDVLRAELRAQGVTFLSDTDSEVVAHLLNHALKTQDPKTAWLNVVGRLQGAFALAVILENEPELMLVARHGPPLALGQGEGEMFVGSDAVALSHLTNRVAYLEDGDCAFVTPDGAEIVSQNQGIVHRPFVVTQPIDAASGKGDFPHFMLQEIHEQPTVLRTSLSQYMTPDRGQVAFGPLPFIPQDVSRLTIVACGTAYLAGAVAKQWFETIARVPVDLDIASEFRYRMPPLPKGGVALFISQSGETADTLAAQAYAKSQDQICVGIINVPNSSLDRSVDLSLLTHAGVEIGVASTKAFMTQLSVLALLNLAFAHARGTLSSDEMQAACQELLRAPALIEQVLQQDATFRDIAAQIKTAKDALYIGRGVSYPMALEGALKLKEISYIHAEGYAAGELKHGPIALIEETVPVIAIAPSDALFDKTMSNVHEVMARKGRVILISDAAGHARTSGNFMARITMPDTTPLTSPFIYALPLQLLAYHTAVLKGTDVDQPRNLAKSVTVE